MSNTNTEPDLEVGQYHNAKKTLSRHDGGYQQVPIQDPQQKNQDHSHDGDSTLTFTRGRSCSTTSIRGKTQSSDLATTALGSFSSLTKVAWNEDHRPRGYSTELEQLQLPNSVNLSSSPTPDLSIPWSSTKSWFIYRVSQVSRMLDERRWRPLLMSSRYVFVAALVVVLIVLLLIVLHSICESVLEYVYSLTRSGVVDKHPYLVALASFAVMVSLLLVGVPFTPLEIASGFLFHWKGLLVSFPAKILGSLIFYCIVVHGHYALPMAVKNYTGSISQNALGWATGLSSLSDRGEALPGGVNSTTQPSPPPDSVVRFFSHPLFKLALQFVAISVTVLLPLILAKVYLNRIKARHEAKRSVES